MDNKLKRSIGFGSAFSIVIGTIIGSGIFFLSRLLFLTVQVQLQWPY